MRSAKLTRQEKSIEDALLKGEYTDVAKKQFEEIAQSIACRKKDAVLNIRGNSGDLKNIKQKAKKFGIKYQTFVSEIFHRLAQA